VTHIVQSADYSLTSEKFLGKTIIHCQQVLKGLFTDTPCNMGSEERFKEYEHDEMTMEDTEIEKKWKTEVRKCWKALINPGEKTAFAKEILVSQLEKYDKIFLTHFEKTGEFYMTDSPLWRTSWAMYVDALIRHSQEEAERPEENTTFKTVRDAATGKTRFAMKDYGEKMQVPPPFPILTKSVIPIMVKSVNDIESALCEVRIHSFYCSIFTNQQSRLLSTLSVTLIFSRPTKSIAFDFVGHTHFQ
jgi:hypothetical protein